MENVIEGLLVGLDSGVEAVLGRSFPRQPLVAALLSMTILIALAAVFVVWRNWGHFSSGP